MAIVLHILILTLGVFDGYMWFKSRKNVALRSRGVLLLGMALAVVLMATLAYEAYNPEGEVLLKAYPVILLLLFMIFLGSITAVFKNRKQRGRVLFVINVFAVVGIFALFTMVFPNTPVSERMLIRMLGS